MVEMEGLKGIKQKITHVLVHVGVHQPSEKKMGKALIKQVIFVIKLANLNHMLINRTVTHRSKSSMTLPPYMTSPIKYFRLFHGIFGSLFS